MTKLPKIDASTSLNSLGLIQSDIVLEEIFALSRHFGPLPQTIGDIANESGKPISFVIQKVREILQMEVGVLVTDLEKDALILDVRLEIERKERPLPIHAECIEQGEFPNQLKQWSGRKIICLCDDGCRSYSSAMALRELGFGNACFLKGGISALKKLPSSPIGRSDP